jgi:hypothetical protein
MPLSSCCLRVEASSFKRDDDRRMQTRPSDLCDINSHEQFFPPSGEATNSGGHQSTFPPAVNIPHRSVLMRHRLGADAGTVSTQGCVSPRVTRKHQFTRGTSERFPPRPHRRHTAFPGWGTPRNRVAYHYVWVPMNCSMGRLSVPEEKLYARRKRLRTSPKADTRATAGCRHGSSDGPGPDRLS